MAVEEFARDTTGSSIPSALSQSLILNANAPNLGSMYVFLKEFGERAVPLVPRHCVALGMKMPREVRGASTVFGAPAIDGLGTTAGFKLIMRSWPFGRASSSR